MDDAGAVGMIECRCDLIQHADDLAECGGFAAFECGAYAIRKRSAGQQAHHHVKLIADHAIIVDRHDVDVFESGGGLRFTQKARGGVAAAGDLVVHHLDCHPAVEVILTRLVDGAHAADTHAFDEAITPQRLTDARHHTPPFDSIVQYDRLSRLS